ncbi:hypothetical protein POSPLADRAFT_1058172 [Postia placenta MAD-698-R-SB12]|uniref:Ketoreductase (KR) domain-containing protein n=1 Tax=Postia placenta MAD-698-R-SB12 TaxID=670580 RepID=A0A1X6MYI7_9APHY|nr:hypothetical protein POSPLADRAFT_1058172 [Postia placenta MAD-698-R-SB12]OSX61253.1 hypothetical protein POSPLADRAFT_1058172 [Postia placenta MAD-698-R-SB12]
MPSLSVVRAANAKWSPSKPPTTVFLGGTSGIGQALARALARYTDGNAHIVLCGRSRATADTTLASLPRGPHAKHAFEPCDASLMRGAAATTATLRARLPKLNVLVLSPGFFSLRGRDPSSEGIDRRLALFYYARWKFVHDLLPLLRAARDAGEDARVMSVLAPGTGGRIDLDDLGLKQRYNIARAYRAVPTYNDLMIEAFAEREPGIAFTHAFPGIVRTPMMGRLFQTLLYPIATAPDVCAEHLLYALLAADPGASRWDNKGNNMGKTRYYGSDEARQRLWEHTEQEIDRAMKVEA